MPLYLDLDGQMSGDINEFEVPTSLSFDDALEGTRRAKAAVGFQRAKPKERTWGEFVGRNVPGLGVGLNLADAGEMVLLAGKIREGSANQDEYDRMASYLKQREDESKEGWLARTGRLAAMLPGFAVEFGATGGAFTGTRKGVESLIGKAAAKSAAGRVASFAAGAAAQTAANPARLAESMVRRRLPDSAEGIFDESKESVAESIFLGAVDQYIEMGTERMGAQLAKAVGVEKLKDALLGRFIQKGLGVRSAAKATSQLLEKAGYHGIPEELLEEHAGEIARWATRVNKDAGVTGDVVSGVGKIATGDVEGGLGDLGKAASQEASMATAFSLFPAAGMPITVRTAKQQGRAWDAWSTGKVSAADARIIATLPADERKEVMDELLAGPPQVAGPEYAEQFRSPQELAAQESRILAQPSALSPREDFAATLPAETQAALAALDPQARAAIIDQMMARKKGVVGEEETQVTDEQGRVAGGGGVAADTGGAQLGNVPPAVTGDGLRPEARLADTGQPTGVAAEAPKGVQVEQLFEETPGATREPGELDLLAVRAGQGDRAAGEELFQRVYPWARESAAARGVQGADRDDLAQEEVLKLLEVLPQYDPSKGPFENWARRVMARKSLDEAEKGGRRRTKEGGPLPTDVADVSARPPEPDEVSDTESGMSPFEKAMQNALLAEPEINAPEPPGGPIAAPGAGVTQQPPGVAGVAPPAAGEAEAGVQAPSETAAAKEPWEMSKSEFYANVAPPRPEPYVKRGKKTVENPEYDRWRINWSGAHEEAVRAAHADGKIESHPDYPELSARKASDLSKKKPVEPPQSTAPVAGEAGGPGGAVVPGQEYRPPRNIEKAVQIAQGLDPDQMNVLLGAFQHAHKAGYVGREAQSAASQIYYAKHDGPVPDGLQNLGKFNLATVELEEAMRPAEPEDNLKLPDNGYWRGPKGGKVAGPKFSVGDRVSFGNSSGTVISVKPRFVAVGPKGQAFVPSYRIQFDSGDMQNAGEITTDEEGLSSGSPTPPVSLPSETRPPGEQQAPRGLGKKKEEPGADQDYSGMSDKELDGLLRDLNDKHRHERDAVRKLYDDKIADVRERMRPHRLKSGAIKKGKGHQEAIDKLLAEQTDLERQKQEAVPVSDSWYDVIRNHPAQIEQDRRWKEARERQDAELAAKKAEMRTAEQSEAAEKEKQLGVGDVGNAAKAIVDYFDAEAPKDKRWESMSDSARAASRDRAVLGAFQSAQKLKDALDAGDIHAVESMFGLENPMWVEAFKSLTGQQIPKHKRGEFFRNFFGPEKYDSYHAERKAKADAKRAAEAAEKDRKEIDAAVSQQVEWRATDGTRETLTAKDLIDRLLSQGWKAVEGKKGVIPVTRLTDGKSEVEFKDKLQRKYIQQATTPVAISDLGRRKEAPDAQQVGEATPLHAGDSARVEAGQGVGAEPVGGPGVPTGGQAGGQVPGQEEAAGGKEEAVAPAPARTSDLGRRSVSGQNVGESAEVPTNPDISTPAPETPTTTASESFEARMIREEDMNDYIKAVLQTRYPPKDAEEAWQKYTAYERSRGVEVPGKDYFILAWESFQKPKTSPTAPTEPAKEPKGLGQKKPTAVGKRGQYALPGLEEEAELMEKEEEADVQTAPFRAELASVYGEDYAEQTRKPLRKLVREVERLASRTGAAEVSDVIANIDMPQPPESADEPDAVGDILEEAVKEAWQSAELKSVAVDENSTPLRVGGEYWDTDAAKWVTITQFGFSEDGVVFPIGKDQDGESYEGVMDDLTHTTRWPDKYEETPDDQVENARRWVMSQIGPEVARETADELNNALNSDYHTLNEVLDKGYDAADEYLNKNKRETFKDKLREMGEKFRDRMGIDETGEDVAEAPDTESETPAPAAVPASTPPATPTEPAAAAPAEPVVLSEGGFPLHTDGEELSWVPDGYFTDSERASGYAKVKTVLRAMRQHKPQMFASYKRDNLRATSDRMFGHNAKRLQAVIDAVEAEPLPEKPGDAAKTAENNANVWSKTYKKYQAIAEKLSADIYAAKQAGKKWKGKIELPEHPGGQEYTTIISEAEAWRDMIVEDRLPEFARMEQEERDKAKGIPPVPGAMTEPQALSLIQEKFPKDYASYHTQIDRAVVISSNPPTLANNIEGKTFQAPFYRQRDNSYLVNIGGDLVQVAGYETLAMPGKIAEADFTTKPEYSKEPMQSRHIVSWKDRDWKEHSQSFAALGKAQDKAKSLRDAGFKSVDVRTVVAPRAEKEVKATDAPLVIKYDPKTDTYDLSDLSPHQAEVVRDHLGDKGNDHWHRTAEVNALLDQVRPIAEKAFIARWKTDEKGQGNPERQAAITELNSAMSKRSDLRADIRLAHDEAKRKLDSLTVDYGRKAGIPAGRRHGSLSDAKQHKSAIVAARDRAERGPEYAEIKAKVAKLESELAEAEKRVEKAKEEEGRTAAIEAKAQGILPPGTILVSREKGPAIAARIEGFNEKTGQYDITQGAFVESANTFFPQYDHTTDLPHTLAGFGVMEDFVADEAVRLQADEAVQAKKKETARRDAEAKAQAAAERTKAAYSPTYDTVPTVAGMMPAKGELYHATFEGRPGTTTGRWMVLDEAVPRDFLKRRDEMQKEGVRGSTRGTKDDPLPADKFYEGWKPEDAKPLTLAGYFKKEGKDDYTVAMLTDGTGIVAVNGDWFNYFRSIGVDVGSTTTEMEKDDPMLHVLLQNGSPVGLISGVRAFDVGNREREVKVKLDAMKEVLGDAYQEEAHPRGEAPKPRLGGKQRKAKASKPAPAAEGEKKLTKAQENSIDRILDARDRIATGKGKKKQFESDMATIRLHAGKLGIEVGDIGRYFHTETYLKVADEVSMEVAKRWGSHPTAKRQARRDAIVEGDKIRDAGYGYMAGLPRGKWVKRNKHGHAGKDASALEVSRATGIPTERLDQIAKETQERGFPGSTTEVPNVADIEIDQRYEEDFDKLWPVMDRQVGNETSANRKLVVAIGLMENEPPAVKEALARRLQQIAPDAIQYAQEHPTAVPIGMRDLFRAAKSDTVSETPAGKTLKEKAAEAGQQAAETLDEISTEIKKTLGGTAYALINPKLGALVVKFISLKVKEGVYKFADMVNEFVKRFGPDDTLKMAKYIESAWTGGRKVMPELDETGKVAEIVGKAATKPARAAEPPTPPPADVSGREPGDSPDVPPVTSVTNALADEAVGIKKRLVNARRLQSGLEPVPIRPRMPDEEKLRMAEEMIKADPNLPDRLIDEMLESPHQWRDEAGEVAVIQIHNRGLLNSLSGLYERRLAAKDDAEMASVDADIDLVKIALARVDSAAAVNRGEWHNVGETLQWEITPDYDLAVQVRRLEASKRAPASAEEVAELKKLTDRLKELEEQIAKRTAERDEALAKAAADKAIADTKTEVAKPKGLGTKRQKAKEAAAKAVDRFKAAWAAFGSAGAVYDPKAEAAKQVELMAAAVGVVKEYVNLGYVYFTEFWDKFKPELGDNADKAKDMFRNAFKEYMGTPDAPELELERENLDEIRKEARKIMRAAVEDGITDREAVVDIVHEELKTAIPDLTRREAMDAMSGYGDYTPPTDDEVSRAIAAIRGELQKIAAIQDIAAKQAPKYSGRGRLPMGDEERRLLQQLNEAKRNATFITRDTGRHQKSALQAAKTALRHRIADLDEEIRTGQRIVGNKTTTIPDAELLDLRAQRDELMAQHRQAFPKAPMSMEKKLEAAERALDRAIGQLEKDLAAGNIGPKPKPTPLSSPALEAKRAKLDALRAQREDLREAANPKLSPEERAELHYQAILQKRTADYKDRIARKDFAKKPKVEKKHDKQTLDMKFEADQIRKKFKTMQDAWELAHRPVVLRALGLIPKTFNASRAIITSIDFSAVMRQGGWVTASHPLMSAKAIPAMLYALSHKGGEFAVAEDIRTRPNAQLYQQADLGITETAAGLTKQEEAYMGEWAKHIPGVAASERAYVAFLNRLRADLFDSLIATLTKSGAPTLHEAKVIAHYVNVATGRGSLGPLKSAGVLLATVFFSPRYLISRLQLMSFQPMWGGTWRTRKLIATEYARALGGIFTFYGTLLAAGALYAAATGGGDDDWPKICLDWNSSDFGKVSIGNTRIDPLMGMSQIIVFSKRMADAMYGGARSLGGMEVSGHHRLAMENSGKNVIRFSASKASPWIGNVAAFLSGETFDGKKLTPARLVREMMVPMSVSDAIDAFKEQGVTKGTALTMLTVAGVGVSTFAAKNALVEVKDPDARWAMQEFYRQQQAAESARRYAREEGFVPDEVEDTYWRFTDAQNMAEKIMETVPENASPETVEKYERYWVGLVRESLGKPPDPKYPSPIGDTSAPQPVRKALADFVKNRHPGEEPARKAGESEQDWRSRKQTHKYMGERYRRLRRLVWPPATGGE